MAPNEADRCVAERRSGARGGLAEGGRAASGSWFDGISWKGLAVLLAVCLVNAVRRNVNSPALREDFVAWLADIGDATLTGSFVGLPVMLTLVAIVNRRPLQGAASYALPLLAAAVASALGTMALLGYETDWLFIGDSFLDQTPRVGELFMTSWSRYLILSSLFAVV